LQLVVIVVVGVAAYTAIAHCHIALHRGREYSGVARIATTVCLAIMGLSATRWIEQHNRLHHPYLNQDGADPDLDFQPVFRLHLSQPYRWWHRFQAFYCWLLYPFTLLGMSLGSLRIVTMGTTRDGRKFDRAGRARILMEITWGPPLVLGACMSLAGATRGLVDWTAAYLVGGTLLGVTFQMNHCSILPGETLDQRDQVGLSRHDRLLQGTLDVHPTSSTLAFLSGSLTRHSAHHLSPARDQTWIAEKTAALASTDACYRHVPTVRAGLQAHFRYMQMLGLGAGARRQLPDSAASGQRAGSRTGT
jgi:linoleoyl-CoA desaturase